MIVATCDCGCAEGVAGVSHVNGIDVYVQQRKRQPIQIQTRNKKFSTNWNGKL